jgi:hypothetical protein
MLCCAVLQPGRNLTIEMLTSLRLMCIELLHVLMVWEPFRTLQEPVSVVGTPGDWGGGKQGPQVGVSEANGWWGLWVTKVLLQQVSGRDPGVAATVLSTCHAGT